MLFSESSTLDKDRIMRVARKIKLLYLHTPLIPESARRAMAEQVVCRALGERPLSSHRATAERNRSVAARHSLGGRSASARQTTCRISGVDVQHGCSITNVLNISTCTLFIPIRTPALISTPPCF